MINQRLVSYFTVIIQSFVFLLSLFCPVFGVAAEDLRIPVLVGQTGASEVFGQFETQGYTMAVEEWNEKGGVNGRRVVPLFEDTQTSQKQIISAFHLHAERGAQVIMGPTWLDGFPGVIPIARKRGVLLVTPNAAIEAFSDSDRSWPITFYHNSTVEVRALREELRKREYKRVALFYEHGPFAEMLRRLLLSDGFLPAADIGVQVGDADFKSQLLKLRKGNIDALVLFVWNHRSLHALLRQIEENLPKVALATVHDGEGWLANNTLKPLIKRLMYARFLIADTGFEQRFKARFGHPPMLTASNAYDAMNAVLTAFANGAQSGAACRNYLTTSKLDTATFGPFTFSEDGSVPSRVEMVNWRADVR